jgi:adenine-specific DNA-methyltransferase
MGNGGLHLSADDIALIKKLLDEGRPLPQRFRAELFEDARQVELIWQGKSSEVTNVVLPFQSIEQVDEPRSEDGKPLDQLDLFTLGQGGRQLSGWTNKLIWGDNKLVLSSLKNGPLRREIEDAGGLKLIYIDPPFDVGADFSFDIEVGGEEFIKEASVIEELAYRDTWGKGTESYLSMLYERLRLAADLLSPNGSIYVHVGWQVSGAVRVILDEIFGPGGAPGKPGFKNEIAWKCTSAHSDSGRYGINHQTILFYVKGDSHIWNSPLGEYEQEYVDQYYRYKEPDGRRFKSGDLSAYGLSGGGYQYEWNGHMRLWRCPVETMQRLHDEGRVFYTKNGIARLKGFLDESEGLPVQTIWADKDVQYVVSWGDENTGYDTQKSQGLLKRIIEASSSPGDLVMDFFCGSGTTLAVAEKLGRKWIGCDLGRFAIHTTRKRMIAVQRELKSKGENYRAFEILNLGKYERQFFAGINPNLPEEEKVRLATQKEEQYLHLILTAYKAERVLQSPPFHGRQGATMVIVGPLDAPVTQTILHEALAACKRMKISKVDILGFDFEMGLMPYEVDKAREQGVSIQLRYIPRDVFDKRAVEKGQVKFYDVAYLEIKPVVEGQKVRVELADFGVYYRQDDDQAKLDRMKAGASRVIVKDGQVVKVSKDKQGVPSEEVLTNQWTDWIDYWAVDFDFFTRPETVRILEGDTERSVYTGNYLFENEWQSFRTRKDRSLELASAWHEYPHKNRKYTIAVKVIDIFGNDTTKTIEVKV